MNRTIDRRKLLSGGLAAAAAGAGAAPLGAQTPPATEAPARFKLGTVTYNIAADWDLATLLRICQRTGLQAVELRTTHKHGVEPGISSDRQADVRKRAADHGIQIWGLGTICEFHSPDAAVVARNIETCKRFAELSAAIGGRGVKVRPNGLPKDVPVEKTLEQIGRALQVCGKTAAELGQEVWVEVHGAGTSHPPHMKTIMDYCGLANVGVTWNSNGTDVKDGSITAYFNLLRPWIKSCHINELYSNYPWRELFTRLRETGYDRVTLAEIPGAPTPESGERLLRYYRALWQELTRA